MNWSAAAAGALGLAVVLGAFGAHALRSRLDAYSTDVYQRAVFYHFVHALGILVIAMLPRSGLLSQSGASRVCAVLFAGMAIFCGSLYILAVSGVRTWGAITPLGGLLLIAGWFLLAFLLFRGVR